MLDPNIYEILFCAEDCINSMLIVVLHWKLVQFIDIL